MTGRPLSGLLRPSPGHPVPRGGTDTCSFRGLHLPLRLPLPGKGRGVAGQPQPGSTRPHRLSRFAVCVWIGSGLGSWALFPEAPARAL